MIETRDTWQLFFKLRNNITLEGDLELARREIVQLVGCSVRPVARRDLDNWLGCGALLPQDLECVRDGIVGYLCEVHKFDSWRLFTGLSFCELVAGRSHRGAVFPPSLRALPARLTRLHEAKENRVFAFIPFNAMAEWSDIAARRARSTAEVQTVLNLLCDALINPTSGSLPAPLRAIAGARQTTGHLFHGLHVYKAKFFPRMARALLNLCGGCTVLDPFSGSGTALIEASVMGKSSVGVDIDPLSAAITAVKASLLQREVNLLGQLGEVVARVESLGKGQASLFEIAETGAFYGLVPTFLRKRIPEPILREVEEDLACILSALRGVPERSVWHILLSDAISRKFKFRFLGLGYGRFSLTIQPTRLRNMFLDNLRALANAWSAWQWLREVANIAPMPIAALHGDARALPLQDNQFDTVITSPPYMPASSGRENYLKSKAFAMTVLGLICPDEVDMLEAQQIGSVQRSDAYETLPPKAREVVEWMQTDPTRSVKAAATASYFVDLRQSLSEIRRVLTPGGSCAFVVARQHVFYRYKTREIVRVVENAEITAQLAQQAGLEVEECLHVELKKQNSVARPRSQDAYYETVLMLKKP